MVQWIIRPLTGIEQCIQIDVLFPAAATDLALNALSPL
jgi:hypothetical protein